MENKQLLNQFKLLIQSNNDLYNIYNSSFNSINNNKITNKFIHILQNELERNYLKFDNYYNKKCNFEKNPEKYMNIINLDSIIHNNLILMLKSKFNDDNHFFPNEIKKYILNNLSKLYIFKFNINGRIVNIYIGSLNLQDSKYKGFVNNDIIKKIKKILFLIYYLDKKVKKNNFAKIIHIYLFPSEYNKELKIYSNKTLGSINVNSGYSYVCSDENEIIIYRNEEWFKVLIHELIHIMGIDFSCIHYVSLKQKIKKIFHIQSNFDLNETYNEFITKILNIGLDILFTYKLKENDTELLNKNGYSSIYEENFREKYIEILNYEIIFSLFQNVKILNYMNLKYKNLFLKDEISVLKRKNNYKENSNVFVYYILVSLLLFNINDVIKCFIYKESIEFEYNIDKINCIFDIIMNNYNNAKFEYNLQKINKILNLNNEETIFIQKTLKMTIL